MNSEKVYLMILDGFGEGKPYPGNAITLAQMPTLSRLKHEYPVTLLSASGNAVGLPEGTQGGSEVGHVTIGAGRIIYQALEEINLSIRNKSFFSKSALVEAMKKAQTDETSLHLLGMISDSGIHSHQAHLYALLQMAKDYGVKKVYIHAITDGRDVPERSAKNFLSQIQAKITELGMQETTKIASIVGRYFAMDRDTNWDRTEKAYNLYTQAEGVIEHDPLIAIDHAYARGIETDYYIDPIILDPKAIITAKDAVIFWNYRTDRTKQLTYCFTGEAPVGFTAKIKVKPFFVCFGAYSATAPVVFPPTPASNNLGETIEKNGYSQLRIAETEKFAHVTFFFNSQTEKPFAHETRILVESPKVASYAEKPEMSAEIITEKVLPEIASQKYKLIVQNFANPDLVGHSGQLKATISACETIDNCIKKIAEECARNSYTLCITADHGNAEYMIYEGNGEQCPAHTTNPVLFLLVSEKLKNIKLANERGMQDIAPTILDILEISKPEEMSGTSLIIK